MCQSSRLGHITITITTVPIRFTHLASSLFLSLLFATLSPSAAQQVAFTSSDLPIVLIDTQQQTIPDEPKVLVRMRIVDNGEGVRNQIDDAPNDYDGWAGIEIRGASSQMFPKKQYGFETRDADGDDLDVSLLGLPEEEDWILHAPYSDKSLMRNVLTYDLARAMGRYASRVRYCELVIDGEYQGVYVLMEKIKRDKNRVDLNNLKKKETSGDDLTGGYLLQIDRSDDPGWSSAFAGSNSTYKPYYQYRDPDGDDIVPEQAAYIQRFIGEFETVMASDAFESETAGYPSIVDVGSFVDFFLLTELGRNVDGYRLSSYLHKDKDSDDSLLHAGPVWDFNLAYGNANYYGALSTTGFQAQFDQPTDLRPVPFWWAKLSESDAFLRTAAVRWYDLRAGLLSDAALTQRIDQTAALLDEAQERNFERWPILGQYVWPNAAIGESYAEEVSNLKNWIVQRAAWMDSRFEGLPVELTAFTAAADGEDAVLKWETASETNNSGFDVQVSSGDGEAFRSLAWIEGKGTTLESQSYTFRAKGLSPGAYRFRLQQIDLDGATEFSPVVELRLRGASPFLLSKAVPNPFGAASTVTVSVDRARQVQVSLYDVLGREVSVLHQGIVEENVRVLIDGAALPAGLYVLRARSGSDVQTQTLTVVR